MTTFADDLDRLVKKALATGYAKGRTEALSEQYGRAISSNVTALGVLIGVVIGAASSWILIGGP